MPSRRLRRPAFTLIELLVALGIISVLIALTLPAVQGAREAARRVACASNLRQLGLAVASYTEAHGTVPLGRIPIYDPRFAGPRSPCTASRIDKGPLVSILPYAGQEPLYDAINQDVSIFATENATVHPTQPGLFLCPSDPGARELRVVPAGELEPMAPDPPGDRRRMAATSYAASFGSADVAALPGLYADCRVPAAVRRQSDGVFSDVHPIRPASITDGLSHTMFLSEKGVTTFDFGPVAGGEGRLGLAGWWVAGNLPDSLFTAFYPPNAFRRVSAYGGAARIRGASSLHPGGLQVVMGDGSVRFVSQSIDSWPADVARGEPIGARRHPGGWWDGLPRPGVWQAMATRSGGGVARLAPE